MRNPLRYGPISAPSQPKAQLKVYLPPNLVPLLFLLPFFQFVPISEKYVYLLPHRSEFTRAAIIAAAMEAEVVRSELVLPTTLPFKKIQMSDKYPKGQSRARYWKHLKQLLQTENFLSYPPNEPNYLNIESPPSMYPSKKFCDITGFEAPYVDPRTKLRYANPEVFKHIRMLPDDLVQRYLTLRNAAVILR